LLRIQPERLPNFLEAVSQPFPIEEFAMSPRVNNVRANLAAPGARTRVIGFHHGKAVREVRQSHCSCRRPTLAFIAAMASVVVWAASGPVFGFSDTWELVINTGATIVTFLMVFVIQNAQNRDGAAIQAKLDELIRVGESENAFIGIEHLSQEEVEAFRSKCEAAAKLVASGAG
jgi:low affinity Fe/Cu permease